VLLRHTAQVRTSTREPGGRFAGVEGLRGLAAGAVLVSHVYLYGSPDGQAYDLGRAEVLTETSGMVGVVLFFTLSGFLLYRPFAAALVARSPRPSVRRYLRNRLLRIFPGYWFALLGAGLVLRTTYLPPLELERRSLASEPEVLAANLLLVQGYFPSTSLTGIGPAWSLVVEMAFYLVLPLLAGGALLLATRTSAGRRWPWAAALAPAAVLLAVGQAGVRLAYQLPGSDGSSWSGSWHAVAVRSFLVQAVLFAAGVSLAVLHAQVARGAVVLPRWWRPAAGAGAVLLLVPALLAYSRGLLTEHRATLVFSVSCALLLALVVLPRSTPSRLVALLAARPLHAAGLLSYGVFLWHEPLILFFRESGLTGSGRTGFALALVLTAAVSGAVALVSWRLVERPALSLKVAAAGPRGAGGDAVPALAQPSSGPA
jgi:peptidoglycan/LPS O-acetylase OafA/YrhL